MEPNDSGLHIAPLPRIGQELGRFIIERELPRGGQARVYRAWQTDLQRPVALKLLPSSYATDAEALTRFRREIENVARISHPNIVRVFEAGELEGNPYFTMDFIEGQDADDTARRGPMDPDEAATLIEAIARAVGQAHKQGIIHRDIKPGNIIVRRDGTPVLTDFGLAQDLTHSGQLTQTGISMGTPAYMAPEQARGERNRVGVKTDIYAMGATLYTLLTGKRPVEGDSTYELMLKVAESQGPKWPRTAMEDIPPDLRAIVEMAMGQDPARRYDSADELADDLERYLRGEWVVARSRGKLTRLWLRLRRFVPVAAVIVVALGLAGGMVYTGLNPDFMNNAEGGFIDEKNIFRPDPDQREAIEPMFGKDGTWTQRGGVVTSGQGGEIVLARTGAEPLFISPKERACWGDFTLDLELRVRNVSGPLELLVGMPDQPGEVDTAYTVVLGAGARDRIELRRLGVPVMGAYRPGMRPALEAGVWYRAAITRRGQVVSFALAEVTAPGAVVSFEFEDIYPAFATAGRRFAVQGEVGELSLRTVTVTHRDAVQSTEMLLYSVGQFGDAELRLNARLAPPLPADAEPDARNERAGLLLLRASCRSRLGRTEDALSDCAMAKALVSDPLLRTRIFMISSAMETTLGNDDGAIAQLRVAQLNTGVSSELNSWLLHDAMERARRLADNEPGRALRYYDFVSSSALGSPGLVCEALYGGARLRLAMADAEPEQAERLRREAADALQRIEGAHYLRFGAVYAQAMASLLALKLQAPDAELADVSTTAGWAAAAVGAYQADNSVLAQPLVEASWVARLSAGGQNVAPAREGDAWLEAAGRAGAEPVWLRVQQALAAFERPELHGDAEARVRYWRELAELLQADEPSHALPAALCEFFIGSPIDARDLKRRQDNLERALRDWQGRHAAWWFAGAGPREFAAYCAALYGAADTAAMESALEAAAGGDKPGRLVLLKGRAAQWLPLRR